MNNLKFKKLLFLQLSAICGLLSLFNFSISYAQLYFSEDPKTSEDSVFQDPSKKTSGSSQAIYDQGGQSKQFRITESEKGLDFVKKEIASLRLEVEMLKKEVESLKNKNEQKIEPIEVKQKTKEKPDKVPTPF